MDFAYSDEQAMLRDSVDRYGQDEWPAADRLKILAQGSDGARRRWCAMAGLGWLMLPIAERDGGLGGGAVEVMAVMESFGRHLIAAPYVSSCVLVPALIGGDPAAADLLTAIGAGDALAAAALIDADGGDDPSWVETRAERDGDGWRLTGLKPQVEDGADADWFVVSARTAGAAGDPSGIGLFLLARDTPGLTVEGFRAIDAHRHARLTLDAARAIAIGDPSDALPVIEAAIDRAICAYLAEATGSMEAAAAATLDYLRTRQQFGAPIGSFQVLQHRMVDMTIACEEARAMTYHATLSLGRDPDERRRAVSAGKVRVGQSGLYVGQQAVQLHGGVGFSDELIVSHHLRRLMMLDLAHGAPDHHRARYAALSHHEETR
ncbi:acyl-CoA dehydrogenase family protein [Sphingomonas sp. GB1N7]|uniref:acyl-CoA dehydrogenase family protein n=1 Tax=Parasphingomonas caseinilytica TaxID=3096158 RepID=UPI002FCABF58